MPNPMLYMNTANITPRPATVTMPPPCDIKDMAPFVALTVAEDDVLEAPPSDEFDDLPVASLPDADVAEAPPLPFPVFVLVEFAELIPAPPVATEPDASVAVEDAFLPLFVFVD